MGWNTLDIRKDLSMMEEALKKETNPVKIDRLITYISNIKYEIACEELNKFERKESDEEKGEEDVDNELNEGTCYEEFTHNVSDLEKYRLYYPSLKNYIDICDKDLGREHVFCEHGKLELSDDELIGLTHDFYKSTDKYFYNKYLSFEKNKDRVLNINRDKDCEEGFILAFPISHSKYIEVGADGFSESILVSLAHEIGHYIGSKINEGRYFAEDVFVEIESLFFELISNEYYYKVLGNKKFKENLIDHAYSYHDYAKRIMAYKRVHDKVFEDLYKLDKPYEYFGTLSKQDKDFKDIDVDYRMKYLVSYLVATELFEIYKDDKEKALHLLREIIKPNHKKTEYKRITDNIELNNNMKKHVKAIKCY